MDTQCFFSGVMAPDDFDGGGSKVPFLGQEPDEPLVRLSLDRRCRDLHLDPIPVGTDDLVPRGFGLQINFQEDFFHKLCQETPGF